MLTLLVLAVPVVPADCEPNEAGTILVSRMDIAFSLSYFHWVGNLTGDIRGTVEFWEQPENFWIDDTEYFFETFAIATNRGLILGGDAGVYDSATGDFWAHGWVTEATGHWTFLVGYTLFEWGTTSEFGVFPITADDVPLIMLPAQPEAADDTPVRVSYADLAFSGSYMHWLGNLTGDLRGTIEIWELPNYIIGDVEYFFEAFTVTTREGVLHGFDRGMYVLSTGDFWAYGTVTEASRRWSGMVGDMMFAWGTTTSYTILPITAEDVPFVFVDL